MMAGLMKMRRGTITPYSQFVAGMRGVAPMAIGAIPFALIFGALAVSEGGLSIWATSGLSLFVFAGSAQFIAVNLLSQGTGLIPIVLTTLIVNMRHVLYSASLAPYMKHLPKRWLLPLSFWLTDETYATVINVWQDTNHDRSHQAWYHLGNAVAMYTNWNLWTLLGALFGSQLPNIEQWGMDFALVVTFISIVVPMLVTRPMLICALVAGGVSLVTYGMPHNLGLLIAATAAIAVGYSVETRLQPAAASRPVPDTDSQVWQLGQKHE